jgi:20S proteasome alpha/beta subunit
LLPISLLISKEKSSQSSSRSENVVFYDEFGDIPQIKNTYMAISKGVSILSISNQNYTVIGYTWPNSSTLQIPFGAFPFNHLGNPHQHILVTGLAGDCRRVIRFAKETTLNATFDFGGFPKGGFIAEKVGLYLQEATGGASRPLACHVILVDSLCGEVFEIDVSGTVNQVWGAVAGLGAKEGYKHLENSWINFTMPLNQLQDIAKDTLALMLKSVKRELDIRIQVLAHNRA